jgi:glutathione synthase/RimK-type ligase-like ATP-grasp enzyme
VDAAAVTAPPAPRVCFVTCVQWPEVSESDGLVKRALEARGATVAARAWNAADARFDGFDAVVFRSNWDYHHAPEEFLAWLARGEASGVPFWNPADLVRWNLSKRYLLDLEKAGIPVVPTVILEEGEADLLPSVMAERAWQVAVVKPLLSASAHDTTLVPAGEAAVVARAIADGRIRRPAMVQPFVEEIRSRGEWSLVFIDGALTHAVLKHPGDGDFRVQPRFGGRAAAARPDAAVAAVGRRALDALPLAPLYARVDGVETAAGFTIMEVELHEPGLFFPLAPEAAGAFADAILRRTRRP